MFKKDEKMYWKDELDAIYQKNQFGINFWDNLIGSQVELLLRSNKRIIGAIIKVLDTDEGLKIYFKQSGCDDQNSEIFTFSKRDIKFIDPFLK